MSYNPDPKTDSLNEMFSRWNDFVTLSPNLLNAKDEITFEIWLEKLELIDSRFLFLFLREHYDEIKPECMRLAQRRFDQDIKPEKKDEN